MMNKTTVDTQESEIEIKKILLNLYAYKWMILLFVILFGVASALYAYFLPNVYRSSASVKVGLDEKAYAKDVISMAMGKGAVNASTEKDLIRSNYLAQKALKYVDFREHYYSIEHYKERELYKKSPIKVVMQKGYGIPFLLTIIDEKHYRLEVQAYPLARGGIVNYNKVHTFGKVVRNSDFELIVNKVKPPQTKRYRFVIDKERKSFGHVSVSQHLENSTILQIAVEDTVPLRAQEYANALAQAYVEQNVESKVREAKQRIAFIESQLLTVSENLKKSTNQLENFRKTSKIVNVEDKAKNITQRLTQYEESLMTLRIKEEMLKTFYAQVKSNKSIETLSIEGIDDKDSILNGLMQKLQEAVVEKKLLRQDYTNLHPSVLRVESKIKQLKRSIRHTVENLLQNIQKREKLLSENVKKQKKILNTLPENKRKYEQLEAAFKMNEEMKTYLLKRRAEAQMIQASSVSKNRLLDSASYPYAPIKPKRTIIVLLGMLAGFIVGLLVAFLRILLDTNIQNEEDIESLVAYPVLGVIPSFEEASGEHKAKIKVLDAPKSMVAESFRHLRSNIRFLSQDEASQIILLTSTVGEEGKTTISVNLAAIMHLAGKKTLIINLDMRKPTLHEKFDLPNEVGLSEFLNNRVHANEIIQHTRYKHLDIISSGTIPPNPSELIQSKRMMLLLKELKKYYDVILLDTPPIGLVTDVKELMHFVDINLYIVRADYSKKAFLERLKRFDFVEKISHMGIILNDVTQKRGNYRYYNHYGYYEE